MFAYTMSIRRVDHDELRTLGLIPRRPALLVNHSAIIHRHAACWHRVHHRPDDRSRDTHGRSDCCGRRHRVIIIVPTAVIATTMVINVYVHITIDVDVVHAGVSDIVGARIGLAIPDILARCGAASGVTSPIVTARVCASTTASTSGFQRRD